MTADFRDGAVCSFRILLITKKLSEPTMFGCLQNNGSGNTDVIAYSPISKGCSQSPKAELTQKDTALQHQILQS